MSIILGHYGPVTLNKVRSHFPPHNWIYHIEVPHQLMPHLFQRRPHLADGRNKPRARLIDRAMLETASEYAHAELWHETPLAARRAAREIQRHLPAAVERMKANAIGGYYGRNHDWHSYIPYAPWRAQQVESDRSYEL